VALNTAGSRFDTLLAVYTGATIGSLTPVAGHAAPAGTALSRVTFNVTAGTVCMIAVDGRDNTSGLFRLNWTMSGVLAATRLTDGSIEIAVEGAPGETCTLEASTNFADWIPVTALLNESGRVPFPPQSAAAPARFYRVKATPPAQ
jgi:hypothetical protein